MTQPAIPAEVRRVLGWLIVFGDPIQTPTSSHYLGALLWAFVTWLKIIGVLSMLAWVFSWLASAINERAGRRLSRFDLVALAALVACPFAVLVQVLETSHRIRIYKLGGVYLVTWLALLLGTILFVWVEAMLWRAIRKLGKRADLAVLLGLHLSLVLGLGVAFYIQRHSVPPVGHPELRMTWRDALAFGARLSATFMGYVVLLRVLGLLSVELFAVRARRLFAIARLTVIEANRRMWAPWVVIACFGVVLAFTHWFLQPPRPAEMGRLFVGTLSLVCTLLLTVMVTILTPLSLPYDIQQQTIYTVVSKPVRRIELIWGRMLGFMALVTVLVVVFYGASLAYLARTVGSAIRATDAAADKAARAGLTAKATQLREQADQMRTRMAARVPIGGALTFLDSRGTPHRFGIDVGADQSTHREPRSHIEGASPATAIWQFGIVPDSNPPHQPVDHRIPVASLLPADTLEGMQNQLFEVKAQIERGERVLADPKLPPAKASQFSGALTRNRAELQRLGAAYQKAKEETEALEAKATALPADRAAEADELRGQIAQRHAPPIPLEMTLNVYRTTKGELGKPVFAELQVTNPNTNAEYRDVLKVHEYYTNKQFLPASILVGSLGALKIEVRCMTRSQYLGMAQSDLYLLAPPGTFGLNFLKGLFGVWLQAMVLTAIGVCAGTFLSWPVALLTTLSFFIAGEVAFTFLLDFTRQSMLGGGPFESMLRLINHENQMNDLTPTLAVVTVKTLDSMAMPLMSRLVYVVPNFAGLDVSNTVADGYNVSWWGLLENLLMAVAYAVPFSIAGYFILKNREVAA